MSLSFLLEQKSSKSRKQLRGEGWSSTKPENYTPNTHNTTRSSDGYIMYKEKGDQTSSSTTTQTDQPAPQTNSYEKWGSVFKFTTEDDKEVRIAFDNELISAIEKFKRANFDEDDAFVRAVAETYPKIRYIHYLKGTANLKESVEIKGLSAILVEQEYQTWTVMRATDGINFKLRPGKIVKQPSSLPGTPAQPQQSSQQPQQASKPAKPEGEEVLKKEQDAVSKVVTDEKQGDNLFTTEQKRYIGEYNQNLWTTEKPSDKLSSYTDTINLKEKHPDTFKEDLFMYKPKDPKAWAKAAGEGIIENQSLTRGFCRTMTKVYYDIAMKNMDSTEQELNNMAQIVMKCQDQIDNYNDFGLTKKRLYDLGSLQGERKKFKLNFGSNTRG